MQEFSRSFKLIYTLLKSLSNRGLVEFITAMRLVILLLALLVSGCVKKTRPVIYKPAQCSYTYTVNNKTYCVRKSAVGYVEEGIASWYGPGFHGRRTASGEFYNMYALTAAHKTLPLGTYVRVTNLENGKSVIVRINDRGPFVEGRIIDLSYAAAKKLGMLKKGTARVRIVALGKIENLEKGNFYVQVGAFKSKMNAYRMRYRLKVRGIPAKVVKSRGLYRVLAGPVHSKKEAEKFKARLNRMGIRGTFIVRY